MFKKKPIKIFGEIIGWSEKPTKEEIQRLRGLQTAFKYYSNLSDLQKKHIVKQLALDFLALDHEGREHYFNVMENYYRMVKRVKNG